MSYLLEVYPVKILDYHFLTYVFVCVCHALRPQAVPGDRTCIPIHPPWGGGGPEAAPDGSALRV